MVKIAVVVMMVMAGGCTGIVVGRPGPGRGEITLTNRHEYYDHGSSGSTHGQDDAIGNTSSTFLVAGLFGPSKSTLTGTPTSTGLGLDAFGEYLYNTPGFFGLGARVGYTSLSGTDMAGVRYSGFPVMLEAAIGTRVPGRVDTERSFLGSITGLALSLHGGVGYVASGTITHAKASADVGAYRGNLGLRLTLPITLVQFTLTAEVAYTSSKTVQLEGVDTSFQSTSILFGNIVAF